MALADLHDIRTTCTVRIGGVVYPPRAVARVREADARSLVSEGRAFFVPKIPPRTPGKTPEPSDPPKSTPEPEKAPEGPVAEAVASLPHDKREYRDKSHGPNRRK